MEKRVAYPIYLMIYEEKTKIEIPDFGYLQEIEGIKEIGPAMGQARMIIESKAREYLDDGVEIPKPGEKEHKKVKGEINTYVDVKIGHMSKKEKAKTLEEIKKMEEDRANSMMDCNENCFEFIKHSKLLAATITQRKLSNKVKELALSYPDEVQVLYKNEDGSIFAHMPVSYLHIYRPVERAKKEYTEEERQKIDERMEKMHAKRKENAEKRKLENSKNSL